MPVPVRGALVTGPHLSSLLQLRKAKSCSEGNFASLLKAPAGQSKTEKWIAIHRICLGRHIL